MKYSAITSIAAVAAIVALPACTPQPEVEAMPQVVEAPPPEAYDAWALMVDGQPVEEVLQNRERADAVLQQLLGRPFDRVGLERLIAQVKEGGRPDSLPEGLTGISLFTTVQFLDAYVASLASPEAKQTVSGKIRDYIYDDAKKAGHLAVDTKVEFFDTAASYAAKSSDRVERYHWDIDVLDGTYEVIPKSNNPNDPFPGTLQFNADMVADLNTRGLDHKLWARNQANQGKIISVRHVYQIFDDGSIARLPNGHLYYQTTDESCIDLMFVGYPPAYQLPALPAYCLGRCAHPQVVNTH